MKTEKVEENMEACKSCDHNVIIECRGGCFFPHNTPPCFRQAVESQTTVVQQRLYAEPSDIKTSDNRKRWDFAAISMLILVNLGFVTGIIYGIRWLISLITGGE